MAAGAVLVLWIVSGLYASRLQEQVSQINDQVVALQAQVAQLQAANTELQQARDTLQQQVQDDQNRLALIANANPAQTVMLPGTAEAPEARGAFYSGEGQGLLLVRGLEPLSAQQSYQLWLIPATAYVRIGVTKKSR